MDPLDGGSPVLFNVQFVSRDVKYRIATNDDADDEMNQVRTCQI